MVSLSSGFPATCLEIVRYWLNTVRVPLWRDDTDLKRFLSQIQSRSLSIQGRGAGDGTNHITEEESGGGGFLIGLLCGGIVGGADRSDVRAEGWHLNSASGYTTRLAICRR